ncbi:MAG: hypothetical protein HRT57_11680 [Crocinitomicaceae bacterium]|nr:hypothetical protein [Crocinitomicaceae bacterium]
MNKGKVLDSLGRKDESCLCYKHALSLG